MDEGAFAEIGERVSPFDLASHSWDTPGEELLAAEAERRMQVARPPMGESMEARRPLPGGRGVARGGAGARG